jgi:hypothetical protein
VTHQRQNQSKQIVLHWIVFSFDHRPVADIWMVLNLCFTVFHAWFSLSLMVRQESAVISKGVHGSVRFSRTV